MTLRGFELSGYNAVSRALTSIEAGLPSKPQQKLPPQKRMPRFFALKSSAYYGRLLMYRVGSSCSDLA
jgi:hypothetical protein